MVRKGNLGRNWSLNYAYLLCGTPIFLCIGVRTYVRANCCQSRYANTCISNIFKINIIRVSLEHIGVQLVDSWYNVHD